MTMDDVKNLKILSNWELSPGAMLPDVHLPDCSAHTLHRTVVVDADGRKWILEEIAKDTYGRKTVVADTLEELNGRGLKQIHPYRRNTLGQFITSYSGQLFMLRPHVDGIGFERNFWLEDVRYADVFADFLIQLRQVSGGLSRHQDERGAFSIIDFIKIRTEVFRRHRPEIAESLSPVILRLKRTLFLAIRDQPTAFCHGDFRPLNAVWGGNAIESIIDWDFCGVKPETYDAALFLGWLGFENPDAIISEFAIRFINRLRDAALFSQGSWEVFFDLIIAIRYGWLAEWMRTNNERVRDLEILYMNLLTTQKKFILKKWGF